MDQIVDKLRAKRAFRVDLEKSDSIALLVEFENSDYNADGYHWIGETTLKNISFSGLGFVAPNRVPTGEKCQVFLTFKGIQYEFKAQIVRYTRQGEGHFYGASFLCEEHTKKLFMEKVIRHFSSKRLRHQLIDLLHEEFFSIEAEKPELLVTWPIMFQEILSLRGDESFFELYTQQLADFSESDEFVIGELKQIKKMWGHLVPVHDREKFEHWTQYPESKYELKNYDEKNHLLGHLVISRLKASIDSPRKWILFYKKNDLFSHQMLQYIYFNIEFLPLIDHFTYKSEKVYDYQWVKKIHRKNARLYPLIGKSNNIDEMRKALIKVLGDSSHLYIWGEYGSGKDYFAETICHEYDQHHQGHMVIDAQAPEFQFHMSSEGQDEFLNRLDSHIGESLLIKNIQELSHNKQSQLTEILKNRNYLVLITGRQSPDKLNKKLQIFLQKNSFEVLPLRKRKEDIWPMVIHSIEKACQLMGTKPKSIDPDLEEIFTQYQWLGNLKELVSYTKQLVASHPDQNIISLGEFDLRNFFMRSLNMSAKGKIGEGVSLEEMLKKKGYSSTHIQIFLKKLKKTA